MAFLFKVIAICPNSSGPTQISHLSITAYATLKLNFEHKHLQFVLFYHALIVLLNYHVSNFQLENSIDIPNPYFDALC